MTGTNRIQEVNNNNHGDGNGIARQEGKIEKRGFVKSKHSTMRELFGPTSPLPDLWRVFEFIKYKIEDNRRTSGIEWLSREYILKNTGADPSNFARMLKYLEKHNMLEIQKKNSRALVFAYKLHPKRFGNNPVEMDRKKKTSKRQIEDKKETETSNLRGKRQIEDNRLVSISELLGNSACTPSYLTTSLNLTTSQKTENSKFLEEIKTQKPMGDFEMSEEAIILRRDVLKEQLRVIDLKMSDSKKNDDLQV